MTGQRVIVVGAGIGGLVAALELAHHGVSVTVVDSAASPGGKMRQVEIGGLKVDAGPTVLTMRWVLEELFAELGESLSDHLVLRRAHTLARHAWSRIERLDLFADLEESANAIGEFSGAAEARRFMGFAHRAKHIYDALERPFLRAAATNVLGLTRRVGWRGLPGLARISPFTSMWNALGQHFHDPRLRQLFGRYATYCGSSPFMAPATLMLVAHVEQEGVWLVDGGMHKVAQALTNLAVKRGVEFRFHTTVQQILVQQGKACGVRFQAGEMLHASSIVFNGDPAALACGMLGDPVTAAVSQIRPGTRSLSALTWTMLARTQGFPLLRHNVFFSSGYANEFDDLFSRQQYPQDPTVYICAQDRSVRNEEGRNEPERLLCLINAPANADLHRTSADDFLRHEGNTFRKLERFGLRIERDATHVVRTTPDDFDRLFPGSGGALYGPSSHGWAAAFRRPRARSRLDGLYLAGGGVHPGPGVPMAALSGRQAAASVLEDLRFGSRKRFA